MLSALSIRNLLMIDRLDIEFEPGLNVLTGETGAGKSILLDALGLVLGMRSRIGADPQGVAGGEVAAGFELAPGSAAKAVLDSLGIPEDGELVLRRAFSASGRKPFFANDRRCSAEAVRPLAEHLVEIHGQHDDSGLMNRAGHRSMLDDFAENDAAARKALAAWKRWQGAISALSAAEAAKTAAAREEEFLRHAVRELEEINPEDGETLQLEERRRLIKASARIRDDLAEAQRALGFEGAERVVGDAVRVVERLVPDAAGGLDQVVPALDRALAELGEANKALDEFSESMRFDPHELERVEDRLFALRALARKHRVAAEDLGRVAEDLRGRLDAVENADAEVARSAEEEARSRAEYEKSAQALSRLRKQAASRLDKRIKSELEPLKLGKSVFKTALSRTEFGPHGQDAVEFTVATGPGAPVGPIRRIASGGELSRFLLALKVCLASDADGLCMIFDEIDRGVGGATADAVGRRLRALAKNSQVLVVTHSPQVAALGDHHWRIAKPDSGSGIHAEKLAGTVRVEEIGRMLAGGSVTDQARAAAEALLSGA